MTPAKYVAGIEQRSELVLIAAIVAERVRHDDLRVSVDRGLCIVALDVAVLGLEDAALGIGEVALRFGSGAATGGGLRGGFSSTFARAGCSAAALAFASASNSALAW